VIAARRARFLGVPLRELGELRRRAEVLAAARGVGLAAAFAVVADDYLFGYGMTTEWRKR